MNEGGGAVAYDATGNLPLWGAGFGQVHPWGQASTGRRPVHRQQRGVRSDPARPPVRLADLRVHSVTGDSHVPDLLLRPAKRRVGKPLFLVGAPVFPPRSMSMEFRGRQVARDQLHAGHPHEHHPFIYPNADIAARVRTGIADLFRGDGLLQPDLYRLCPGRDRDQDRLVGPAMQRPHLLVCLVESHPDGGRARFIRSTIFSMDQLFLPSQLAAIPGRVGGILQALAVRRTDRGQRPRVR